MDNLSLGLLFPKSRNAASLNLTVASMIARSMDSIPRDFSTLATNPIECLLFPLKSIIAHTYGYKLSDKLLPLAVSALFDYHPVGHFLKAKDARLLDYEIRFVAQKFFKATSDGRCTMHLFFLQCLSPTSWNLLNPSDIATIQPHLDFQSFKQGLLIQAFDPNNSECKSAAQYFRASVKAHSYHHLQHIQTNSTASWSRFWRLSLICTQRNVIYRFIYDKIPTRLLLGRLFPNKFPSNACFLCSAPESIIHFFFRCPQKSTFWDLLIREFLWPSVTIDLISSCIKTLNFTPLLLARTDSTKADILVITALSELWKAHWRSVFDDHPFSAASVLSNTILALERRKAEDKILHS